MEFLSSYLRFLVNTGHLELTKSCQKFGISHLLFADDMLVILKAKLGNITSFIQAMDNFASWSGLHVNKDKFNIFFSGLNTAMEDTLLAASGFSRGFLPVKYLGLPLISAKLGMYHCLPLGDMMVSKLQSWKAYLLSWADRVILVRSVVQTMYIYTGKGLSLFLRGF